MMKVQIDDISPIKKKLNFEVPQETYQEALDKAYRKLGKTVKIKGFRQGKVPRSVLEKYYGAKTSMETVSDLVDQSYRQAVTEHSIPAVGMPNIQDLKMEEGQPVTFSAEVEVQPKVEAKHYEKIKVKKKPLQVTTEEMEAELQALQKSQAQWVPVDSDVKAEAGHSLTINYEGTQNGIPFEGGKGENVPVTLGLNRFLPDFEKALVGSQKGQTVEFDLTFPQDYGAEALRNQTVQFKAEILEIKREELPSLDDELAKDLGKYETIAQVKEDIEKRLLNSKEAEQRGELFKQVLDHLIAKNSFEIPEAMITRELDYMWRSVLNQLQQQKLTPEQVGLNQAEYQEKNREEATRRIKGFLLFDSVADQEKLEVQESEVEAKLAQIAQGYGQPVEVIKNFYQQQNLMRSLYSQILEEKTLDFILTKAKISEK